MPTNISDRGRALILLTIMLTLFLEMVGSSLFNVAIPGIKAGFHADAPSVRWLISGYACGFGMTLLLAGRVADAWGHRRVYLSGMLVFVASSLWCALAPDIGQLIAARSCQGIGNAMVAPQVMAFLQILFIPTERVAKLPYLGLSASAGSTLGPIMAGTLMVQAGSWRAVFLTDTGFGLVALACGALFLPRHTARPDRRVNLGGTVLLSIAIGGFMLSLAGWGRRGGPGTGATVAGMVAIAAIALVMFWRRRAPAGLAATSAPTLYRRLTGYGNLCAGALMTVGVAGSYGSFLVIFNFALQHGRGYSPLFAGLMHLPYSAGAVIGMILLGRRYLVRHGRRVVAIGAMVLATGASLAMVVLGDGAWPLAWSVPALVLAGMGVGMTAGCIGLVSVAWVHVGDAGMAAALLRLGQQMGSVLGSVVIVQPYLSQTGPWAYPRDLLTLLPLQAILLAVMVLALRWRVPLFPPPQTATLAYGRAGSSPAPLPHQNVYPTVAPK